MGWVVGIDSGSTMCKAVLFKNGYIEKLHIEKTGWNPIFLHSQLWMLYSQIIDLDVKT